MWTRTLRCQWNQTPHFLLDRGIWASYETAKPENQTDTHTCAGGLSPYSSMWTQIICCGWAFLLLCYLCVRGKSVIQTFLKAWTQNPDGGLQAVITPTLGTEDELTGWPQGFQSRFVEICTEHRVTHRKYDQSQPQRVETFLMEKKSAECFCYVVRLYWCERNIIY